MSLKERLDQNAARIAETQEELARVGRVLGTARLSSTVTAAALQELETEASALGARLENLVSERLRLRRGAAEKALKADLDIARKRLTELIEDIRRYSVGSCFSAGFRDETDRMLRESVVRRADIARDLGLRAKPKVIDAELYGIIDDMLVARLLGTDRDLRITARATAEVFKDLGLLRSDVDTGTAREILWTIMKGIIAAAAGSGAKALYYLLSNMDVTGQERAAARVYEEAWSANRESVDGATSLFAEPVDAASLFGLLFHLSRALR